MKAYLTDDFSNSIKAYISDFSKIYREALCFAINQKLSGDIGKSKLNTLSQTTFKINKRYANSIINDASRHDFYSITNRELEVKLLGEEETSTRPRSKLTSTSNSERS